MKIHVELGVHALDTSLSIGASPGDDPLAALAGLLAARGHVVSLRGPSGVEAPRGVRRAGPWTLPTGVDACVYAGHRPRDVLAERWIHLPCAAPLPAGEPPDLAVVSSHRWARALSAQAPDLPVEVVLPAVEPFKPGNAKWDRLLCVARPGPGLHGMLLLWPRIWERFHVPLALAGDLRAALAAAASVPDRASPRLMGIATLLEQPGILLLGALDAPGARRLLARSLVLLAPEEDTAPLVACAAGVVPVLEPTEERVEEYGSCACFVERGPDLDDAEAWIAAIEQALAERETRAEAAMALAASRSWEACADRWEALLARVLASPPRRAPPGEQRWLVLAGRPADRGEVHPTAQFLAEAHRRGHALRVVTDDREIAEQLGGSWSVDLLEDGARLPPIAHLPDRLVLAGAASCAAVLEGPGARLLEAPTAAIELTGRSALARLPFADRIDLAIPATRAGGPELFVRLVESLTKAPPPAEAPGYVELVP